MYSATGPVVGGSATIQPPTEGPQRRAARLAPPIRIGVRGSFSRRRATPAGDLRLEVRGAMERPLVGRFHQKSVGRGFGPGFRPVSSQSRTKLDQLDDYHDRARQRE